MDEMGNVDPIAQLEEIERRKKLAAALVSSMPGAGHLQRPNAVAALGPALAMFMQDKLGKQFASEKTAATDDYQKQLGSQLDNYLMTRQGKVGGVLNDSQASALMNDNIAPTNLSDPVTADPRKAIVQAMTSRLPEMRQVGASDMVALGKQEAETFGQPVTERGPDGKLISVQYGNRGGRRPVGGAVPFEKPMSVADRVIDPGDPTKPMADYSTHGGETKTVNGDLYQVDSQGKWHKLDNAPKTSVNVNTVNKGETEFMKTLGKDNAEAFKKAREDAGGALKTMATVNQLKELDSKGILSGPGATAGVVVGQFASALGIPVDPKQVNTEAYQKTLAAEVARYVSQGSAARSMTDSDRKALEQSFPQLMQTPEGRQKIYAIMENSAKATVEHHKSMQRQLAAAFPDNAGSILMLNPVDESPGNGVTPGAPTTPVPGVTTPGAPISFDEYMQRARNGNR